MVDQSVLVPMTLSDLERRDARGQVFQTDLLNNARTVQSAPQFGGFPFSSIYDYILS